MESGDFEGPNFHYAAQCIGMTGGHTDSQLDPLNEVAGVVGCMEPGGALCDGVPDCLKKTRQQLRKQADVIKVMTTGGVLSAFDQPEDAELSLEEVTAIVQDAARAKRVVAAHAHGAAGIRSAIDGGVHTIEHGSYMTQELAFDMVQKGMIYHPTEVITQEFNASTRPDYLTEMQWAKGTALLGAHSLAVRYALDAGVTFATGTVRSGPACDCPYDRCDLAGTEAKLLVELYGMAELAAIEAATANGPLSLGTLGLAPMSGQLAEGYQADVIALSLSPVTNISALADPDMVGNLA
eukprot:scaffold926_cov408-Prasinococcus_capsulatus_cf.AAC.25